MSSSLVRSIARVASRTSKQTAAVLARRTFSTVCGSSSSVAVSAPARCFSTGRVACASLPPAAADYKDAKYKKYVKLAEGNKIVVLGFGAIGSGVLPLLFRHIDMKPEQCLIIANEYNEKQLAHAANYGVKAETAKLTVNDYLPALQKHLKKGDFLINVSVDVSSIALIDYCQQTGCGYIDSCNEPWAGGYSDPNATAAARSNYAFREQALTAAKKYRRDGPTAVITHGANPGIVSHFVKQALLNIAKDTNTPHTVPTSRKEWCELAQKLNIETIHIAERDTQASNVIKHDREFVNTWSIEGYVEEGKQPAELGWGTHEDEFPHDGRRHDNGCGAAIYLDRPGAATKVRTWTPKAGPFHGHLITHTEAISIADYFTLNDAAGKVVYRPTVNFAYHSSNDAMASLNEVAGREWERHKIERLMMDEIQSGRDELGVLLMGHKKNAYWFGSDLDITQVRALVPNNNATSLQVCTSVLAGTVWAMENPTKGFVEPEEIDHARILEIATPYLGTVHGKYTNWTPLDKRNILFQEPINEKKTFAFKNFRVW